MRPLLSLFAGCAASAFLCSAHAQIKAYDTATPSYIEFSAPRFAVDGCETNAVITVVRTGDFRRIASVEYSTKAGSAEENVDYRPCGGTIVFAAGQSFKTISIPIVREQPAPVKTFQIELAAPASTSVVLLTSSAEIEIKSAPPELAIEAAVGGNLKISWADVGLPFTLESLNSGFWGQVVETQSLLLNGNWSVTVRPNAQVELFRLRLAQEN